MNQNQFSLFSSGLDLATLLVNSDLLHHSWVAISETRPYVSTTSPFSVVYGSYQLPPDGGANLLAFVSSADFTVEHLQGEGKDLVSSATLKDEFSGLFDFISTKVNPSFSIHRAAITLYMSLHDQLSSLKNQIDISKPLVITGHSLGGSIATLFTLWLQHNIDLELQKGKKSGDKTPPPKRPVCITFGSPLVGDDGFQRAISERPSWISCFLNVVSNHDPVPRLFISPHNPLAPELASHTSSVFKPFGTFLFCSESGGCACFDEHESILGVMAAMSSVNIGNRQTSDYGSILDSLKQKALVRGISELGECNLNPLRVGITLQLEAVGVINTPGQENNGMNTLITRIEAKQAKLLTSKRNVYEPTKKLNDMKISMTYMEWYKKAGTFQGGYYDYYKNPKSIREIESQQEIVKHQRMLTQYWKDMVEEKDKMPQKEGVSLRNRWLYGGGTYRRMVEPLDISEYYKGRKRDYITNGRSDHYILLEKWMNDDKKDVEPRKKASSLTEDSCFWAHVEEAIISCRVLEDELSSPENKSLSMSNLSKFETYVMESIKNFSVDPETFLEKSSFMQWWNKYKEIKGRFYNSWLTDFMANRCKLYA